MTIIFGWERELEGKGEERRESWGGRQGTVGDGGKTGWERRQGQVGTRAGTAGDGLRPLSAVP